jgi:hypothetical protein
MFSEISVALNAVMRSSKAALMAIKAGKQHSLPAIMQLRSGSIDKYALQLALIQYKPVKLVFSRCFAICTSQLSDTRSFLPTYTTSTINSISYQLCPMLD